VTEQSTAEWTAQQLVEALGDESTLEQRWAEAAHAYELHGVEVFELPAERE
jgi:hypothetical protein